MLNMSYVDTDDWGRPMYRDDKGRLWQDVNLGKGTPDLHRSTSDEDLDGEPNYRITEEYEIIEPAPIENPFAFEYSMLDMLRSKCEYFLNWGNRGKNIFDDGTGEGCIAEMKRLWNLFPADGKPEWLTMGQIYVYELLILGNNGKRLTTTVMNLSNRLLADIKKNENVADAFGSCTSSLHPFCVDADGRKASVVLFKKVSADPKRKAKQKSEFWLGIKPGEAEEGLCARAHVCEDNRDALEVLLRQMILAYLQQ